MSRRGQEGYALAALVAAVTIMLIFMGAAIPSWRYVIKNDREEELLFRGGQIADAVNRYQKQNGGTLPVSMEILTKGRRKYLRKAYTDPMVPDGKWRFVPVNQPCPVPSASLPGSGDRPPTPTPPPSGPAKDVVVGPFQGVVSRSTEKSLRIMNGQEVYSNWCFLGNGQPRIIGKPPGILQPGGTGRPPGLSRSGPGAEPSPR